MKKINLSQLRRKLNDQEFLTLLKAAHNNTLGESTLKNTTIRFDSIVNRIQDSTIKNKINNIARVDFVVMDI